MPIEQGKSNNRFRLAITSQSFTVKIMKPATVSLALVLIVSLAERSVLAQAPPREHQTPLDEALELYQECTGNTVLRSPNLPSLTEFNKPILSSDTNGMRIVLENELLNKGIELIPLDNTTAMAVESGWKNSPTANYIATIKPRPTQGSVSTSNVPASTDEKPTEPLIPRGTIDFRGADINQFLEIYALLLNRNLLRAPIISSAFKLHTQTPFTKSAVIYLLEVSLALNGIASVDDGTNFLQIVPINQVANLKLGAPQRNPDDALLEPNTIQDFRFSPGSRLVDYYAELTGRTVSTSKVGGPSLVFKAQTRLTKPELLYALETTLALNGLAIVELDDKTVRAGYLHELKKADKKP
jgi:hypothetical protein